MFILDCVVGPIGLTSASYLTLHHRRKGTLVREYNGITYRVAVLDTARFELDGLAFKSLSAVARAITGTSYSGPVFFGLKPSSRARKAAAE